LLKGGHDSLASVDEIDNIEIDFGPLKISH
jgi:hypothetical protein